MRKLWDFIKTRVADLLSRPAVRELLSWVIRLAWLIIAHDAGHC